MDGLLSNLSKSSLFLGELRPAGAGWTGELLAAIRCSLNRDPGVDGAAGVDPEGLASSSSSSVMTGFTPPSDGGPLSRHTSSSESEKLRVRGRARGDV